MKVEIEIWRVLRQGIYPRICVTHLYTFFRKRHPKKEFKKLVWKTEKATYPTWKRDVKEISVVNEEAFKYMIKNSLKY